MAFLVPLAMGCASPGPPLPPSLHLPKPVENLRAERVADEVRLTWTTPATTTDGYRIKGPMTAVVCLDTANPMAAPAYAKPVRKPVRRTAAPAVMAPCRALAQVPAVPGPGGAVAAVPATGPATLVGLKIDLRNAAGRSAGPSAEVLAAAGAAPPEVMDLRVSARRGGVLAEWRPDGSGAIVELHRTLTAPGPALPAVGRAGKDTKAKAPPGPGISKADSADVALRAGQTSDAGGMLDRSAVDGSTYTYVAQRVLAVTLDGHPLELRSAVSAPVSITYRDVFPPKAPAGLELVPSGGFGESPSIDLSWAANAEDDVLGYNVYRAEGGAFVKLNADLLPAPAYRDLRVEPGRTYSYRVTAVDGNRNESAPSATVRETLRK